ncbi:hypothetical protein KC19_4G020400 [Ceratodon purpureus]|uniref:UspA domain-containing protein n=1 Tax=Ceratodon purpureus TaxID=3225 RepID=A0A8T0I7D4_CERPU|nr:hypothetical protein KC19_4G020400 [Ceratodon purpureus]
MSSERNVGVALDYSESSKYALKWVVDNLVREGDQLIVVVVHKEYSPNDGQYQLFGKYGSPLIPLVEAAEPSTQRQYGLKYDEEVHSALKEQPQQRRLQ